MFCSLVVISLVAVLAALFAHFKIPMELHEQNLAGKLFLVTGCTPNGIGYSAVSKLLEWNATVICTMRPSKSHLLASLNLHTIPLELDSLQSVREAANLVRTKFGLLDGLVLNAGRVAVNYTLTGDGFESTFQANHLAQFYFTQLLIDRLKPKTARVVFVSSGLHRLGVRSPEYESKPAVKLGADGKYDCWNAYAQSKFFNVLSAKAFAKRFSQVQFLSVSPGMVRTNIEDVMETAPDAAMNKLMLSLIGRSVESGAVRTLQALTDPKFANVTGFHLDDYVQLPPFPEANEENADWLFKMSNALLLL
ncbi:hypothetical protein BASA81_010990 [Batrachochytrium salamandrivorans]|nr:hypothetical protein BASA81_010990 [Batrachochytrium salamandrivorans]